MKLGSFILAMALAFTGGSALAQTKKKTKAKAKTNSSQTIEKPTEELPKKEVPGPEVTPDMTAPPPTTPPEAAAPTTPPPAAETKPVDAPATAAETKPYSPTTGSPHLFGLSAAMGIPHPMRLGLEYVHPSRIFSVELGYGAFGLTVTDVTVKMTNMEAALRWHPWAGSFYLGAMFGTRTFSGEKTETISGSPVTAKAEVKSNYAAPYFGWLWGGQSKGIFASVDFGYMTPMSPSTTFTTNASAIVTGTTEYQRLDADVKKTGNDFGEKGLPMWTVFRLGFLF